LRSKGVSGVQSEGAEEVEPSLHETAPMDAVPLSVVFSSLITVMEIRWILLQSEISVGRTSITRRSFVPAANRIPSRKLAKFAADAMLQLRPEIVLCHSSGPDGVLWLPSSARRAF
jgi:hypothetical protein